MNTLYIDKHASMTSWNRTLQNNLVKAASSFDTNVVYESMPAVPNTHKRSCNFSIIAVKRNNKKRFIGIDTWDNDSPTDKFYEEGHFSGSLSTLSMVLKIQWMPNPLWDKFTQKTGIPITPWVEFPSQEFPLKAFQWDAGYSHPLVGVISGANRFGRGEYHEWAMKYPGMRVKSFLGDKKAVTMDQWVEFLRGSRWGISLGGKRGTDKKNRREVEFSSCGMPLALNYEPHYPFPFEPNKHYVLLTGGSDLARLSEIDPRPYAIASQEVWKRYFSPGGSLKLLFSLMDSLLD